MSFGSTGFGGFGANNQTQPAANTGFGGFGAANTNTNTGGELHRSRRPGYVSRPGTRQGAKRLDIGGGHFETRD